MKKMKAGRSYADGLQARLENPDFAAVFLTTAAEDAEPRVYLAALREVAKAYGIAKVAARAGLPRESVYRALSPNANPRWSTLAAIIRATGVKLTLSRPS